MEIDQSQLIASIEGLFELRARINSRELSPMGAWIHTYTVSRIYPNGFIGEYTYAKWQAKEPIFSRNPKKHGRPPQENTDSKFTRHQHIGRVSSNTGLGAEPQTEEAYQSYRNRQKLEAIESAISEIQSILSRFKLTS